MSIEEMQGNYTLLISSDNLPPLSGFRLGTCRKQSHRELNCGFLFYTSQAKGSSLSEQEFADAIVLLYERLIEGLPDIRSRGTSFDDLKACKDLTDKPVLQSLSGEAISHKTDNKSIEVNLCHSTIKWDKAT
ncbi:hypothetical protein SK128_023955 [Halocaridina rubra]|uniref:Uncharacterized protein n=1 Tax=Halocaridina rubra TaxID=373956 RepID=A0AAN8X7I2_HALRR